MKRLGFVIISLLLIVGNFSVATTASAAVTREEYVALKAKIDSGLDTIRMAEEKSLGDVVLASPGVLSKQVWDAVATVVFNVPKSGDTRNPNNTNSNEYLAINLKRLYVEELDKKYNQFRNDPDVNIDYLEKYSLEAFLQTLNKKGSTGAPKDVQDSPVYLVSRFKAVSQQLLSFTDSRINQKAGIITSGEKVTLDNAATQNATTELQNTVEVAECSVLGENPVTDCLDAGLTWFIKNFLLKLVGFAVWLSANLLNYSMKVGIFEFKTWAPDSLYLLWSAVRQMVSVFVFFAGLWVFFMSVIGRSEDAQKYFAFLILFGLFVNFSYPLTRVAIDISNITSLKIYESTFGPGIITAANGTTDANGAGNRIMNSLGLPGLVRSATAVGDDPANQFEKQIRSTPGALAAVVFIGLVAWFLFLISGYIIARTAILVFIMAVCPILFVDIVVPKLGETAAKLRKLFFSQLIVAPVFCIMLALTLKFLEIFNSTAGNALAGGTNVLRDSGSSSNVAVFFNLIMMIIMLHIMMKVTKEASGAVGDSVSKVMGGARGLGIGMATGGVLGAAAFAGRNTIGRASKAALNSEWLGSMRGTKGGEALNALAGWGSKGSFDARRIPLVKTAAGIGGLKGMGQGGGEGGYAKSRDVFEKKVAEEAANIKDAAARERYLNRNYNNLDTKAQRKLLNLVGASGVETAAEKALKKFTNTDLLAQNRTNATAANYLNADQASRESILANAANNKQLQEKLDTVDKLRGIDNNAADALNQKIEALKKLDDPALVEKLISRDLGEGLSKDAAVQMKQALNQAFGISKTDAAAAGEYDETLARKNGQTIANQAQLDVASSTNQTLQQLATNQADLHQLLQGIFQNTNGGNTTPPPAPQPQPVNATV
jgi:hypothetical protein